MGDVFSNVKSPGDYYIRGRGYFIGYFTSFSKTGIGALRYTLDDMVIICAGTSLSLSKTGIGALRYTLDDMVIICAGTSLSLSKTGILALRYRSV